MTSMIKVFAVLGAALLAVPGAADTPAPFPEFTFRRVGVPPADADRRITVQIAPSEEAAPAAAPPPAAGPGAYDWFWQAVSPLLADSGPGRLAAALDGLAAAPDEAAVPEPSLQDLSRIAGAHGTDILIATVGTQVSPAFALAVIAVESAGDTAAVSRAGAEGLMQLMPDTAARFGVSDPADAAENIRGGVAYLDWLMKRFGGDPVLVLAGYNAGEGAVRDHAGVPPFPETRAYVPRVLAAWGVARALCKTPPELLSDGCVFAVPPSNG
jgi:soluble lytic murein transglycosylase-like protein